MQAVMHESAAKGSRVAGCMVAGATTLAGEGTRGIDVSMQPPDDRIANFELP